MASHRHHPGGFHAGGSASDHGDLLRFLGRRELGLAPSSDRGIHLAGETLVFHHAGLAGDAARARTDVGLPPLRHLGGVLEIGQQAPAHDEEVGLSRFEDLLPQFGVQPAHHAHRDRHHCLDGRPQRSHPGARLCGVLELLHQGRGRLRVEHLLGRRHPPVGVVAVGGDVEVVGSGRLDHPGERLSLLDRGPQLVPVFRAFELHAQDEVVAGALAAGLQDLDNEPGPVL